MVPHLISVCSVCSVSPWLSFPKREITTETRRTQRTLTRHCFIFALLLLLIVSAESSTTAQRRKTNVDLIIRSGTVVTMDGQRRVIENGAVAVKGGRIIAAGRTAEIVKRYAAGAIG